LEGLKVEIDEIPVFGSLDLSDLEALFCSPGIAVLGVIGEILSREISELITCIFG
jgi:hypothetical protein